MEDRERYFYTCAAHCCPDHGCKYGDDDCPVQNGRLKPLYRSNNACAKCKASSPGA